jgi:hypothetical protein
MTNDPPNAAQCSEKGQVAKRLKAGFAEAGEPERHKTDQVPGGESTSRSITLTPCTDRHHNAYVRM